VLVKVQLRKGGLHRRPSRKGKRGGVGEKKETPRVHIVALRGGGMVGGSDCGNGSSRPPSMSRQERHQGQEKVTKKEEGDRVAKCRYGGKGGGGYSWKKSSKIKGHAGHGRRGGQHRRFQQTHQKILWQSKPLRAKKRKLGE